MSVEHVVGTNTQRLSLPSASQNKCDSMRSREANSHVQLERLVGHMVPLVLVFNHETITTRHRLKLRENLFTALKALAKRLHTQSELWSQLGEKITFAQYANNEQKPFCSLGNENFPNLSMPFTYVMKNCFWRQIPQGPRGARATAKFVITVVHIERHRTALQCDFSNTELSALKARRSEKPH